MMTPDHDAPVQDRVTMLSTKKSAKKPEIIRDKKGRIIKGIAQDTNKNGTAGTPCTFCQRKEELLKITRDYIDSGKEGGTRKMVYVNELAILLGGYRDIIIEWRERTLQDGKTLEHPEFANMIKELESMQEFRLQQRLLQRFNPTGAIFLLKTKHKYMEVEKQILAGSNEEPLNITIVEEEK